MPLPEQFLFSQSSLQDYTDCARRFDLRYLQQVQWPAVEAEPVVEWEKHLRRGADFHHLIHQHLLGIPEAALSRTLIDADLRRWWRAYLNDPFVAALPGVRYPEITLSAPLNGHRLLAKYDLIALQPGERARIVDWKTTQRKSSRSSLEGRLQTVIYRYVLVEAGAHLNGGARITPEQIEMVYWFSADPTSPEHFPYDAAQHTQAGEHLSALIDEIQQRKVFDMTTETRRCAFCPYRSYCERGIAAGQSDTLDNDDRIDTSDTDFDFDQIAEIAF